MNWVLNIVIGVLAVVLTVLIVVRVRLKRRLNSIDGIVGVTSRSKFEGKLIGGEFTKVYPHKKAH